MEYRSKVADTLVSVFGVQVEAHHHEVATAGQCEVDFRYGGLTKTADNLQTVKICREEHSLPDEPGGHIYAKTHLRG